jgi:hypothetical protein
MLANVRNILLAAAALAAPAFAQDLPKTWADFSTLTLNFSEDQSKGTTWSGVFDEKARDFLIDVQMLDPQPAKGRVGMVAGRVMVSKGMTLRPGYEIDAIDGPILSMRLVLTVLGRVFPDGPGAIVGLAEVGRDDDVGIRFGTPSASGYIAPPWRVSGTVENYNAGAVAFDLRMTVPAQVKDAKNATGVLNFKGRLATRTGPVFRDGDSLEGWTVYTLGPQAQRRGTGTLDYGAKPIATPRGVKTFGELRAFAATMR